MTSSADQPESSIHDDGNEQHAVVESRGLIRTTFRDRRRQNLLAIAFAFTIASVGILWWQGFFEVMRASSAPTIPAGVLWQDLCDEAKKERSEKLQASFEVNAPSRLPIFGKALPLRQLASPGTTTTLSRPPAG